MIEPNETEFNTILQEFRKYRDRFGMNQLYTDGEDGFTTQNGALFTMEYLLCLVALKPDALGTYEEVERIRDVYQSLEMASGLTSRFPGSREGDSMDNMGSSLVFSALYDSRHFAKRMLERGQARAEGVDMIQDPERNMKFYPYAWLLNGGKAPKNFWNNTRPTEFCMWGWFGRSPGFMGLLNVCATDTMSPLQAAALWVGQFLGCFKKPDDADARKLPYIVWQLLKNRNWFWRLSYRLWCFILMRTYKNGMQDVYARYYQDAQHPLRRFSPAYLR